VTFDAIFVPDELLEAVSDAAWLEGMLDFERALAVVEARAGVIPAAAGEAIAASCRVELFDREALVPGARAVASPVEPLVRTLRELVGGEAATYVHWGATSQDVMDTASMLVSRRALAIVLDGLDGAATACAGLARAHRGSVMAGRTLLQQAVPTTFGAGAAGWLVSLVEARARLRELGAARLAVELGGAAGTLSALGDRGVEVLRLLAEELDLAEPTVPWHTGRVRVAELGGALAVAAGVLAKVGLDVALLAQTEIGEVREPAGKGGSSTMPHKRNPIGSALAIACARRVAACASVLTGALVQEHQRALGAWHAEWGALTEALALTGGAAAAIREVLGGLEVDAERMRANMTDLLAAEPASFALAARVGRTRANELVAEAARRATWEGSSFRDELARAGLSGDELDRVLDPAVSLGSAEAFVDRALALYEAAT
jgi:3-carboxy-cis,cis-muconate cycloisomerase